MFTFCGLNQKYILLNSDQINCVLASLYVFITVQNLNLGQGKVYTETETWWSLNVSE